MWNVLIQLGLILTLMFVLTTCGLFTPTLDVPACTAIAPELESFLDGWMNEEDWAELLEYIEELKRCSR